ncbi:MAG: GNAT family N-acetyltransferase [Candidatus Heimdallarchaeota archaeon]|nr:GNAT family N-acetyltransferase [Candidatus Heimdallarchaeota archaeon]
MNYKNYSIIEFNPKIDSDELFESYLDLTLKLGKEKRPDEPEPPKELLKQNILMRTPEVERKIFLVQEGNGKIIGKASISFSTPEDPAYEKNKFLANISLAIVKEHRGKGLGTILFKELVKEAMKNPNVLSLLADVWHETGHSFCQKYNGSIALETAENRLYLADVDWSMIEHWKAECNAKANGSTLETYMNIPNDLLQEFVDLYSELSNQQPLGDVDIETRITPEARREMMEQLEQQGIIAHTKITRESDGSISGISEILSISSLPHRLIQLITGVKENYRGRGLGKWLKADMMLYIRNNFPEVKYIQTDNATTNAPMLSINDRMGFKKYISETIYKFKLQDLIKDFNLY